MKKITLLKSLILAFIFLTGSASVFSQTTLNFDNSGSWILSGSGTSYSTHAYSESGVTIQGTDVVRETTATQDGFAGFFGTYAMRLRNTAISKALLTISTGGLANFSFKVRRWDASPMPSYTVKYSVNGGTNWINLTNIDGTLLTTSDWFTYSSGDINSAASNIQIVIANTGTTERIMIDDFTWTGLASSCTASNLAFANATVDKTMADAAFTQTATSLNGTTAITYASNNTDVANVDGNGQVTLVGAGVATITATQAAGTHSAVDYCAATATYTLNVTSILPTIIVTEVTVPAMVALVGNSVTETVNVSGVNLDENLTISIIDDVNNQFDEPSVTSITKLGDNTATGTVTVTYRPTAAGAHTATLKIESLGATSVTRALSGTGIDPNNPYSLDISSPVSEINETFEAPTAVGFVMPTNWKNVNVVGTKSWEVKLFSTNQYAQMSAFSSTSTQQTMLVSPAIDFDQIVKNTITFDWLAGFAKVGTTLKVYTMTLDGTKTEVKSINTNVPTSGYATVFTTETLDLSSTSGIKFLVFEYNGDGGAAALTTTYQLDNINVQKDLNTDITNTNNHLEVILVNGNIKFSALAGESVEVYSALGQKLVQKLTVSGLNTIPVSARGVVLVKVGNRFAKVIL